MSDEQKCNCNCCSPEVRGELAGLIRQFADLLEHRCCQ